MRKGFRFAGAAAALGLAGGCVDPEGELGEFEGRVIDASTGDDSDAAEVEEVPDASGTYLMGLSPAPVRSIAFEFLAEVDLEFDGDDVTFALSAQPLDAESREPVGDPMTVDGVAVDNTARFEAVMAELPEGAEECEPPPEDPVIIPESANPLPTGDLQLTATLFGTVQSEDLVCGKVDGYEFEANDCLDLSDSDFAMVPVEDGTEPDDLPELIDRCPDD